MKKEEKILTPISQEELEEEEYQKLINLDNELTSYGLSRIERQEIFSGLLFVLRMSFCLAYLIILLVLILTVF